MSKKGPNEFGEGNIISGWDDKEKNPELVLSSKYTQNNYVVFLNDVSQRLRGLQMY